MPDHLLSPLDPDTGFMIVAGVRYCLDRHTYAPSLCVEWLARHWSVLREQDKVVILRDIADHVREAQAHQLSWREDLRTWSSFLDHITLGVCEPSSQMRVHEEDAGELKRQVAALQIQNARLKQERDSAKTKLEQKSREWSASYRELVERYDRLFDDRNACAQQCGDLADGIIDAIGMARIGSDRDGFVNPDDQDIVAAARKVREERDSAWRFIHEDHNAVL